MASGAAQPPPSSWPPPPLASSVQRRGPLFPRMRPPLPLATPGRPPPPPACSPPSRGRRPHRPRWPSRAAAASAPLPRPLRRRGEESRLPDPSPSSASPQNCRPRTEPPPPPPRLHAPPAPPPRIKQQVTTVSKRTGSEKGHGAKVPRIKGYLLLTRRKRSPHLIMVRRNAIPGSLFLGAATSRSNSTARFLGLCGLVRVGRAALPNSGGVPTKAPAHLVWLCLSAWTRTDRASLLDAL